VCSIRQSFEIREPPQIHFSNNFDETVSRGSRAVVLTFTANV
jgi:hypothetical protein